MLGGVGLWKSVDRIGFFGYNGVERLVLGMKLIYKKGIVSYSYKLNGKWVGSFDCDVEDFKKYFEDRKSYEEMMLIEKRGVWYWNKKKWLYLGC